MSRVGRVLRLLVLASAVVYPLVYLVVAILRLGHPYELEWMEGGMLGHVQRVRDGQPLYVPPSLAFVPYIYAPLYSYVAAPVAAVMGGGFAPLRLVSLLASLGCFALVGATVRRETGDREAGLLAAGLLAATYAESGTFFDLARADSLFLLLLLAAVAATRLGGGARSAIACALLLGLACLTKQPALLAAPALALVQLRRGRRQAIVFASALAVVLGAAVIALEARHDGWFLFYAFELTGQGPIKRVIVTFWARDVLSPFAIAALATTIGWWLRRARGDSRGAGDWALLLAALVVPAWASRFNVGSDVNVLMPMHAAAAIGLGLAFHEIRWRIASRAPEERAPASALLWLACLAQLVRLAYLPSAVVPRAADRVAGDAFVRTLAALPQPVFLPNHPYLLERAGLPSHAHQVGVNQLLSGPPGEWRDRIAGAQRQAIRQQRFGAIVLDDWFWFKDDVERCYRPLREAIPERDAFWPVAGARLRPRTIYVPAGFCR